MAAASRTSTSGWPSDAREPLVALVLPVPAGGGGQEVHVGQVLHHLVAELDGGVEAQRRALPGAERASIHAVSEDRLLVQRALMVPRRPVAVVERAELDEAGARV